MFTSQSELFAVPAPEDEVIYTMTIKLRSGKVIRRPNGRPFRIVIRHKRKT